MPVPFDTSGTTIVQYEISRDAQHADLRHDPGPKRKTERGRLGLLGRIAAALCLIDIFGHALGGAELRACVAKHFAHWDECVRRTRALNKRRKTKGSRAVPLVEPLCGSSRPRPRRRCGARSTRRPRTTGRVVAEDIVVHMQDRLGKSSSRTSEEEEFVVAMLKNWKSARIEGQVEARVQALLTVLRVRGIAVPEAVRKRIVKEKDPARLERWHERAILAASAAEVVDEPS